MNNRSPFDIPAANECHECEGRGYTYGTAQIGKQAMPHRAKEPGAPTSNGYVTTDLGYGCLNCGGVGRIVDVL